MNNMELNKIFAALLVAGIVASLSGFAVSKLYHTHELKENAYKIEGVAAEAGGAPEAAAKPEPILDLIATADTAKGQQIAKVCASCHNFDKGGPNGMGPNLYGVVGRAKGGHSGFDYSEGMKTAGGSWIYEELNHFLWKPKDDVPGTKMTFIGLKKPEERAAVIAWLRTLADSPAAMPTDAEIAKEKADFGPAPGTDTAPAATEAGTEGEAAKTSAADGKEDATATAPENKAGGNPDVKEGAAPEDKAGEKSEEKASDAGKGEAKKKKNK